MGNTASNTNNASRPSGLRDRVTSPNRKSTRSRSPSPGPNSPHRPHRSLRQKKKSLELPDLASLGLSPVNPPSRRNSNRPGSSPIPIPPVVQALPNPYADNIPERYQRGRRRQPSDFALDEEVSTHIPIYPDPVTDTSRRSSRGNPFIRGAPLKYTSTQSFTHTSSRPQHKHKHEEIQEEEAPTFVPEAVRSTIPIALHKAEMELFKSQFSDDGHEEVERDLAPKEGGTGRKMDMVVEVEEGLDPIPTKIYWKGGGKNVVLARAGDDNWKGRQQMTPESVFCLNLSNRTQLTTVSQPTARYQNLVCRHTPLSRHTPPQVHC